MKNTLILLLFFFIASCKTERVAPAEAMSDLGQTPYYEVDGKAVKSSEIDNYSVSTIESVTVYKGKDATERYGTKAKDGAVIITTNKN